MPKRRYYIQESQRQHDLILPDHEKWKLNLFLYKSSMKTKNFIVYPLVLVTKFDVIEHLIF